MAAEETYIEADASDSESSVWNGMMRKMIEIVPLMIGNELVHITIQTNND